MAFTTMNRINLGQGNGGPNGVFYAEDIMIVMNQTDAMGRRVFAVELHNALVDGEPGAVLVGITATGEDGQPTADGRLTASPYLVATKCPPSNHQGGVPLPMP